MKTENKKASTFEITLRAIGQALEALGVESFELVLEGDSFVVYGGTDSPTRDKKAPKRFSLFQRKKPKTKCAEDFILAACAFARVISSVSIGRERTSGSAPSAARTQTAFRTDCE